MLNTCMCAHGAWQEHTHGMCMPAMRMHSSQPHGQHPSSSVGPLSCHVPVCTARPPASCRGLLNLLPLCCMLLIIIQQTSLCSLLALLLHTTISIAWLLI